METVVRTHSPKALGALIAVVGMVAALLATVVVTAPSAQALVTWTPLESGTAQPITGVDYKGGKIAYVTAGGDMFFGPATGPFTKTTAPSGATFTDVELNPSGTRALAVGTGGDDGELYVYDGSTWTQPDLSSATVQHRYSGDRCTAAAGLSSATVENVVFHSVAWASNTVGYVVGTQKDLDYNRHTGYALKTTDGGLTWTDMQNRADGTCLVPSNGASGLFKNVLTTSNPARVWVMGVGGNWNSLYRSTDGLASLTDTGADPFGKHLAIDPKNPLRQAATTLDTGYTNWTHTADLWAHSVYAGHNQGHDNVKTIRDLEASPNGWFYIVGDGGLIERTKNGKKAEKVPAAGALRYQNWQSIAFANNRNAVVAGDGGALAITGTANQPAGKAKPKLANKAIKGKGLVKKGKTKYVLQVQGKLLRPAAVKQKQACKGKVRLIVKAKPKGKKFTKVVQQNAKVKPNCKFAKKIVITGNKAKKLNKAKKARLVVQFRGNQVLAKAARNYNAKLVR